MESSKISFINFIANELHNYNIIGDVALFIGCQFALESDFGNSNLATEFNNFCGMKLPLVRRSTAINFGTHDRWSRYLSVSDCVTDYVLCLMYHKPMACAFDSVSQFCYFIKDWYCPEKSYLDKISSIYVQFKNSLKNGKTI